MDRDIFDAEHDAFRASVRSFVTREVGPRHPAMLTEHRIPREVWHAAGEAGLLGLEVPERFGGSAAGDFRFSAVLTEELAGAFLALASCFGIHTDVVASYLVQLGTDEQCERWLPGYCRGELIGAIGMTEPSAGSDLAALRTRAERDGSDWRLTGSKTFITNGASADLVVVAAKTTLEARAKGISLFVVEAGMPGFHRGAPLDKIGLHEADTAELYFDDVSVPAANLLGEVDAGFGYMMTRLAQERIHGAVANVAHATQILAETVDYTAERQAFGRALSGFQHNRFALAEMATLLDVTRAYVDRCVAAHTRGRLSAADSAKAKWWSSDVQNRVLDMCLQLHGGYGFMAEYRVGRAWTDARVTRIWGGTTEVMKDIISRDLCR